MGRRRSRGKACDGWDGLSVQLGRILGVAGGLEFSHGVLEEELVGLCLESRGLPGGKAGREGGGEREDQEEDR